MLLDNQSIDCYSLFDRVASMSPTLLDTCESNLDSIAVRIQIRVFLMRTCFSESSLSTPSRHHMSLRLWEFPYTLFVPVTMTTERAQAFGQVRSCLEGRQVGDDPVVA